MKPASGEVLELMDLSVTGAMTRACPLRNRSGFAKIVTDPDSLHNIAVDGDGDGIITPGVEPPGYGHVGMTKTAGDAMDLLWPSTRSRLYNPVYY